MILFTFNFPCSNSSVAGVRMVLKVIWILTTLWHHDKVLYKEIMMNDDNLESTLLTSSLLKIRSLYKFCYMLSRMSEKKKWEVTGESLLFILLVSSVNRFYWLSQFTQKYNGLLIKSHKSGCGRLGVWMLVNSLLGDSVETNSSQNQYIPWQTVNKELWATWGVILLYQKMSAPDGMFQKYTFCSQMLLLSTFIL